MFFQFWGFVGFLCNLVFKKNLLFLKKFHASVLQQFYSIIGTIFGIIHFYLAFYLHDV